MTKKLNVVHFHNEIFIVDMQAEIPRFSWFYASDRKEIYDNQYTEYKVNGRKKNYLKEAFPFYWLIVATTYKVLPRAIIFKKEELPPANLSHLQEVEIEYPIRNNKIVIFNYKYS